MPISRQRYLSLPAIAGLLAPIVACSQHPALEVDVLARAPAGSSCPRLSWEARELAWVRVDERKIAHLEHARIGSDAAFDAREIASGPNWFVNWADRPGFVVCAESRSDDPLHATPLRTIAAWLEKCGPDTYDYGIRLAIGDGSRAEATEPRWIHEHVGPGEHGFVSFAGLGGGRVAALWLDGRHVPEHKAMSLYTRTIEADGSLGAELVLDGRVCDCCPTALAALSGGGFLAAYRDRSDEEVRDISIVASLPHRAPEPVWSSGDGWTFAGCPVNGPALAARDERGLVAWYTEADGHKRVLASAFDARTLNFAAPVVVSGAAPLGRASVALDGSGRAYVAWLESHGARARWLLVRLASAGGGVERSGTLAEVDPSRASGIGALAVDEQGAVFAYTADDGRVTLVRWTPR